MKKKALFARAFLEQILERYLPTSESYQFVHLWHGQFCWKGRAKGNGLVAKILAFHFNDQADVDVFSRK